MGDFSVTRGAVSQMFTVVLYDSSSTVGGILSGLTSASTNLAIEMRRAYTATKTTYSGANIEAQTTIGTFQAPSSSAKIRFKETGCAGEYELQVHDSATNAFGTGDMSPYVTLKIYESGSSALNLAPCFLRIPLTAFDFQTAAGSAPTAAAIRAEIDANSTKLDVAVSTRLAPTVAARTLDVTNIRVPVTTLTDTVTTYTGNTPQTGDNYPFANRVVIRGTVSATSPTSSSFTCATLDVAGVTADQFKGRIIIFDKTTTTTGLRGHATDILTSSAATLPLLTFTTMPTAPATGDAFSIV